MRDLELLKNQIRRIEYAMLATRGAKGLIVSRPVQTLWVDNDATVWFFTSKRSQKVAQIRRDSHVHLSYSDVAHKIFISITGKAELIVDPQKASELWKMAQTIFFPEGPADPKLLLLKVEPQTAHIWDGKESPTAILRKFATAVFESKASDLGMEKSITISSKR
jgi:general stress protein 26